jgi:hypothetical protein
LRHATLQVSLAAVQILEYSGEEFEDIVDEFFIPAISQNGSHFGGQVAMHNLGEGLALCRTRWGPRSAVRTDRMAAGASEGNRMLLSIQVAGRGHMFQRDRFADLAAGTGVVTEARTPFTWASQT